MGRVPTILWGAEREGLGVRVCVWKRWSGNIITYIISIHN